MTKLLQSLRNLLDLRVNFIGLRFPYNNELLYWLWPHNRPYYHERTYFNMETRQGYFSLNEYWFFKGKNTFPFKGILNFRPGEKILGLSHSEAISLLGIMLPVGNYVVLYDLNLSSRTKEFWAVIPPESRVELMKDIVIVNCKTPEQAIEIKDSIEPQFGSAKVVINVENWE